MYNNDQLIEIKKQIVKIGDKISANDQVFKIERITETGINKPSNKYGCDIYSEDDMFSFKSLKLLKKHLSSVTDEEAIELAKFCGLSNVRFTVRREDKRLFVYETENFGYFFIIYFDFDFQLREIELDHEKVVMAYQYLQLKGYALPQLILLENKLITISVEQQVEYSIIELINLIEKK